MAVFPLAYSRVRKTPWFVFQDESVKTILTGSHKAPSGSTATDKDKGFPKEVLPSLCSDATPSGLTTPHKLAPRDAEVYISTASV
jgi:hypothetical protein